MANTHEAFWLEPLNKAKNGRMTSLPYGLSGPKLRIAYSYGTIGAAQYDVIGLFERPSIANIRKRWFASLLAVSIFGLTAGPASAASYAIDLFAAVGRGSDMNNAGDVAGILTTVGFCGGPYPSCFGVDTPVVFPGSGGAPLTLAPPAAIPFAVPIAINELGSVAGTASVGFGAFKPQPVHWTRSATGYAAQTLPLLPGTTKVRIAGIDNQSRIVGFGETDNITGASHAPFVWDAANGLRNLVTLGAPNDIPLAVSPGGTVAMNARWFRLNNPGVVATNAPLPGYFPQATADINDNGDQAKFLVTSGSQNIAYLFRYDATTRLWSQLSSAPNGRLSRFGLGSIDDNRNVTGTVQSNGVLAPGPSGLALSLTTQLSPAYTGAIVSGAGARNASGKILASIAIGGVSSRLARLTPVTVCTTACIRIADMSITAKRVPTCTTQNNVVVKTTVRDEVGRPLAGVFVAGRFLDSYWLDKKLSRRTNAAGVATFVHRGPGCVGTISFFVDQASVSGRAFDRSQGKLLTFVIPPT